MEAFMGTILPVGFNFAPRGWAFCNGQLMAIQQYSALFALLGTQYGGDGVTTFALPDLRGRVPAGGQPGGPGPGLTNIQMGQIAGTNSVTAIGTGQAVLNLTAANLPAHTHPATLSLSGLTGSTAIPVGTGAGVAAVTAGAGFTQALAGPSGAAIFATPPANPVNLAPATTTITGNGTVTVEANTGGGTPAIAAVSINSQVPIMQPYLGVNFVIALTGIFPSRN